MAATRTKIESNLKTIRGNMAAACARRGRRVEDVTLVAVTKQADLDAIKAVIELGVTDLGESRAQQLAERAEESAAFAVRRRTETAPIRWHMIGHLQRNKVKQVLEVPSMHLIHSVDSLRLAEEIHHRAEIQNRVADVLLEVNCSEEEQKFGCKVGAAVALSEMLGTLPNVRLVGLMTMAPLSEDPEQARPMFVRLRELFEEMQKAGIGGEHLRHLSMGMSQDYAVAVEEGSTLVRIGTSLFE